MKLKVASIFNPTVFIASYAKNFKGKILKFGGYVTQKHNVQETFAFAILVPCSTQAFFYSVIQIYHVETICSFHKTAKPVKIFFLETFHVHGLLIRYI